MKIFILFVVLTCVGVHSTSESDLTPGHGPFPTSNPSTKLNPVRTSQSGPSQPLRDKGGPSPSLSSEEIELKLEKPLSISREQLGRFRKFLSRKGIVVKNPDDDVLEKIVPSSSKKPIELAAPERLSDVTAEDILPLLPRNLSSFIPLLQRLKGEKCQRHGEYFLNGLHNLTKWAVQMFDSATKIPEGVLYGSTFNFGNFDECVEVSTPLHGPNGDVETLNGQYCLANVRLSGLRQDQVQADPIDFRLSAWDTLKLPEDRRGLRKDEIHWAFCLPDACSPQDIQAFLTEAIDLTTLKGLQLSFDIPNNMCQIKRENVYDGYDIAVGVVIALFVLIVLTATALDIYVAKSAKILKDIKFQVFLCFSASKNLTKLVSYSPSQYNLDCIFGIKAITMILILFGHAVAFVVGGPSMNSSYKEEAVLKIENGIFLNNPLLVDTFLMIGAFLLCRILLVELDRRKFINPLILYVARYIRLTPSYAVVIAVYCTWFYKIGSGPLWEARIGLERERCQNSWWTNLLYINNYVNSEQLCMFQSWYLAVDSQFFFLAPAIIYPLWKWPGFGEVACVVTTIFSVAIPFATTYIYQLDPALMMYASEISDLSANAMYRTAYIKTHMRGMSYMIGILLGYIIHRIQSTGYKVPKSLLWCGWIISSLMAMSAMYTVTVFYHHSYHLLEAASYAALHRVGWCLGIAWVIFVCVTNNAGLLNSFFKRRMWVVLSRLSYSSYLVNGMVELHALGTLRHSRNLTNYDVVMVTSSHIVMTYCLALVFSTIFEAPILGIENLFLKSSSKKIEDKASNPSLSGQSTQTTTTTDSASA